MLWRLILGNALMLFMLSWAVRLLLCWEPLLTCSACRAAPFRSKSSEGHICREGHSGPKCRQCAVSYFNRGGLCRGPRQFNPLHAQCQCKVLAPESMMRRLQCRGLPCTTNQLRSAAFGLAWGWGGVGLLILAVMTAAALLLLLHCQSLRATPQVQQHARAQKIHSPLDSKVARRGAHQRFAETLWSRHLCGMPCSPTSFARSWPRSRQAAETRQAEQSSKGS